MKASFLYPFSTIKTPEKRVILVEIKGIYADAKIFTTNNENTALDPYSKAQIKMLCDDPVSEGSNTSMDRIINSG